MYLNQVKASKLFTRMLFILSEPEVMRDLNNTNDPEPEANLSFYWFNFADTGRQCCTAMIA